MQSIKILRFLFQLLVDLVSGVIFPVLLLLEFFFQAFYLHFHHSPEFILLLQQLLFLLFQPVICLMTLPEVLFSFSEVFCRFSLFFFRRLLQLSFPSPQGLLGC